ncbi:MAG: diguanylate cyclase [Acidobacteria bacterium]|nr:diguanylate cyclase [Acidobacteriota bacterium]
MKILAAEDDAVSRRVLENTLLRAGYEVVLARTGNEAWQILQQPDAPEFAILDWMMPGLDGPEICRRLRERNTEPYTYVIFLTARGAKEDFLTGMAAGADDYITKPFDSAELRARVRVGERILQLQRQLISTREALRVQATRDILTGLWNRSAILDILERELARGARENIPVAVLMADVDFFKGVNDTYGHISGDMVLRETARRMQASLRAYDAVGRFGGEEFLVVVPGCDASIAMKQAERLRTHICEKPMAFGGGEVMTTISVGVMVAVAGFAGGLEAVLHAADMALYTAKRKGRNRCELADTWSSKPEEGMPEGVRPEREPAHQPGAH